MCTVRLYSNYLSAVCVVRYYMRTSNPIQRKFQGGLDVQFYSQWIGNCSLTFVLILLKFVALFNQFSMKFLKNYSDPGCFTSIDFGRMLKITKYFHRLAAIESRIPFFSTNYDIQLHGVFCVYRVIAMTEIIAEDTS